MRRKSTTEILIKYIAKLDHKIELLEKRVEELEATNNLITYKPLNIPNSNSTEIVDGIPNCCRGCSNHPSNGGSGICHCTLPYFEDPLKWGTYGVSVDFVKNPDICFDGTSNTYTYDKDSRWKYNINV